MADHYLRKYGVEATIDFELYDTDGASLQTGAVHAAGDSKIMKDEGAEANTANSFTDEGQGYSLVLSAAELQAARVAVYIVDQTSPKVWIDKVLIVETYGHASSQHAFDLDTDALTENEIADAVLKRGVSNTEATADNESITEVILALLESSIAGGVWTIRKTGGTTFNTRTVTKDASADPIVGVT